MRPKAPSEDQGAFEERDGDCEALRGTTKDLSSSSEEEEEEEEEEEGEEGDGGGGERRRRCYNNRVVVVGTYLVACFVAAASLRAWAIAILRLG